MVTKLKILKRIKRLEKEFNKIKILKNQRTIQIFDNFDKMCYILNVFRILSYFSQIFGQIQKSYKYPFEWGSLGGSPSEAIEILNSLDDTSVETCYF